ncbi:hypothetical protein ACIQJT_23990 [Streptomyces sp. NPDC091972]|uniref:hypothetical protein n=1 Tax=Streptomyces sp. NPDC091972 TaxID=3366007 RepID=UPI003818C224
MSTSSGRPPRLAPRTRRYLTAGVAFLVLLAGGYGFWLQYPAAKVGKVCSGMLPVGEILDLSGKSRLSLFGSAFKSSGDSGEVTDSADLDTHCRAGNAQIHVETATEATTQYGSYTFQRRDDVLPVPLGAGWQGFTAESGASVLLSCSNWTAREGEGILAAVSVWDFDNTADMRLELARAVTKVARNAAEKVGCKTTFGSEGELRSPTADAETKPAGEASGTCKGMSSTAEVRETDASVAPVEECVLVGDLQLRAEYGPFSDRPGSVGNGRYGGHDARSGVDGSTAWTSASCQGALGVGYYHATPVESSDRKFTSDPLTGKERADLTHFAKQSAARHGCGAPAALPS